MPDLSPLAAPHLGAMAPTAIDAVCRMEEESAKLPQVPIATQHAFHAGLYARTIIIPAGVVLTGALIKIPTLLILSGDAIVHTEDGPVRFTGYHVLRGAAGRKQAFVAVADTALTMLFASAATTVEEAEAEFTDETSKLLSRREHAENSLLRGE